MHFEIIRCRHVSEDEYEIRYSYGQKGEKEPPATHINAIVSKQLVSGEVKFIVSFPSKFPSSLVQKATDMIVAHASQR